MVTVRKNHFVETFGLALVSFGFWCVLAASAPAQENTAPAAPEKVYGSETNLEIPRFVSMKAGEGNLRRGPSLSHRIDWVLKQRNIPLQITGEFGHWRRVQDRDGAGGWMHYALLSGARTVIVEEDMLAMRSKPLEDAAIRARAELGVVASLGDCTLDWCQISASGYKGWVPKAGIWGVDADEIRN